jgi:beta-lactamase class A
VSGVPASWTVGQKNGFAGGVANSVGFVRHPDGTDGYAIGVLTTNGPRGPAASPR